MARLDPPIRTLTAAVIAALAASGNAGAATPPPSPATGHAAVIAQASIEFTDGSYQWSVSAEVYNAGAAPSPAVDGSDTFFAVTAGALLAADAETPIARIAAGEAIFVRNDATTTVTPTDGAVANFHRIALITGGAGGTGDPFTPGPGVRDVDLVRDVLDPGGTLAIADSDAAPALVVVVTGSVTVAGDPAGSADVTAAAPDMFDGNLTLVNGGTEPAVVLVAVVGTLVQTTASAAPPPTGAPTNGGGDDIDTVQWGPDSPPIPSEYGAWAPSDSGELQCDLSDQAPDHPFWDLAGQICRALSGQDGWPAVDSVPSPPDNDSPYHDCLDDELAALLERALAWHAENPGETPTLALPAAGTHSPCQRSLYDAEATIDTDYPACDDIPRPRVQIEVVAPGNPPGGNDPPATVRGEPSCVPQDAADDGNGFRRLRIMVAGHSEAREVTIDVESDYGILSTNVVLPALPGEGGETVPATTEDEVRSTEPTENDLPLTEPTDAEVPPTEPTETTTVTDDSS